ncbi:hypothetical protein C0995_004746, partial [Termitomyces sp. Mi166
MVHASKDDDSVEAMFEVKYKDSDDPFVDDNPNSFLTTTNQGAKTLGQITSYATCHQAMEFRTHVFSALIFRTYMRLLRWDRSGVVVTKKILFNHRSLFVFFHQFSLATEADRGRDSTVTAANLSLRESQNIRKLLGCNEEISLLKVSVDEKDYFISKTEIL